MREILFRGKRLDNGEWVYGDLSQHKTGKVFIKCGSAVRSCEVDPQTVGEYAGVFDKDRNQVFEGDICKSVYSGKSVCGPVVFYSGCFGIAFEGLLWELHDMLSRDIEVIGNKFDNPDLLKAIPGTLEYRQAQKMASGEENANHG